MAMVAVSVTVAVCPCVALLVSAVRWRRCNREVLEGGYGMPFICHSRLPAAVITGGAGGSAVESAHRMALLVQPLAAGYVPAGIPFGLNPSC